MRSSNLGFVGCFKMGFKCWCRWRGDRPFFVSFAFLFFLSSLFVCVALGSLFAWLTLPPFERLSSSSSGCRMDDEGLWSIGIFYGKTPFSLQPIELSNVQKDGSSAWPVANPVVTCALPSDAGFPVNFVADPFLFIQGYTLYLFFEAKNTLTMQGDIAVARSVDNGATWEYLGVSLDEEWHLSYPYVFSYRDQVYMMPEGNKKGDLRLYRALHFPLQWKLERVLLKKPLIDASMIQYEGYYWLFGSDFSRFGAQKNAELEIWYSSSPLGPWKQHKHNPVLNGNRTLGARNAGRPFIYEGYIYRPGQDCGETYGHRVRLFKVELLSPDKFQEVEVLLGIEESKKGRNAWNGLRYHHLDVQQLPSGDYIAVMDGDRVPSGDSTRRLVLGFTGLLILFTLVMVMGFLVGAVNFPPLSWCTCYVRKSYPLWFWAHPQFGSKLRRAFTSLNRTSSSIRGRMKPRSCFGISILCSLSVLAVVVICISVGYLFGGNGSEEAYPLKGDYSQFTLVTMTYEARLWNLKLYVKHYSRCSSVREIVVVWNKGTPPETNEFDSSVPVRIRVEPKNSLNNRFKVDPLIKTRAVLELDDDIMMTCDDVERGFRVWREHPERIVGFYPRFIEGSPLEYRDERYARRRNGYNIILTGAAFLDASFAFERYWSVDAKEGRGVVDQYFNCEDMLMNFLYANSSMHRTVEYVHPAWAIDTSKISGVAISRDTQMHYRIRTNCLLKFSKMYGYLPSRKWEFGSRKDGWDV
ncbi:glycosyltransferase family protein 64 protein C5 [Amborella trichopoda]|uniref:glycosyltransferase family protein 64 protein C5 n=1 Tax=Amborella trichopoda TaxID=13333 RepID=UPI0009C0FC26|nr:glycosyltransferase family protein 64 protein C5 [Amborella trichopoda]|eukprot:XP_020531678.1 glycosyltransferase family protein 64 protein C5 [Amborella trichopoda]